MNATALREPVAMKATGKKPIAQPTPPGNTPRYNAGAGILLGLSERFSLQVLEPMLRECVAATGEAGIDEHLKSLWLTGNAVDVTMEQSAAIGRTTRPDVQTRIELIVRGFLAAPPPGEPPTTATSDGLPKKHLRCPVCFTGYGGRASVRKWQRQVNSHIVNRCYLCGECGCEWVVEVRSDEDDDGVLVRKTKVVEVRQ